jgi:hypothetical protein
MARTTDMVFALYGHDKTASKTLKGVGKEADSVGEQFKRMGKVAATSFLAVGTAAVAFAASAAKAAIEDQKSQKMLAASLKNTTHATDAQVKSTEDFITKMQLTYGIADDKLRPAFATLTRATGDLGESQKLTLVAMNLSAATGKDLSATSLALAKAHNGNIGALTRLGVPLDKAIIKNKDFNAALKVLTKTFTGAAKAGTETFAGRMQIVQQRVNEAKEQIGVALMPTLETMAKFLTETVVPNVQAFVDGLTGVAGKGDGAYESVKKWGTEVRSILKWVGENKQLVIDFAAAFAAFWAVGKIGAAVSTITGAFKAVRAAMMLTKVEAVSAAAAEAAASGGTMIAIQALAAGAVFAAFGMSNLWGGMKAPSTAKKDFANARSGRGDFTGSVATSTKQDLANINARTATDYIGKEQTKLYNGTTYIYDDVKKKYYVPDISGKRDYSVQPRAVGGSVARGSSYLVGEKGPEIITMGGNGFVTPNNRLGGLGGTTVVINVAGSVIHEKDLAVTVRDNIAQLMRRRGLNPAILGV